MTGSLLDLGCGTGAFLRLIEGDARFSELHGADFSDIAVARASAMSPAIRFHVLDVSRHALQQQFDTITCLAMLEEIEDDEAAMVNAVRMLKPGGRLLVIVPHGKQYWNSKDDLANVRRYEESELAAKLLHCDVKPCEITDWGWPLYDWHYRIMSNLSADASTTPAVPKRWKRLLSSFLYVAFTADDLFMGRGRGRWLIGIFEKQR
jgi:SAM-dependent methyltransferase